jgi:phosphoribosylamine--glycine ligase
MGAYSPAPVVTPEIHDIIMQQVIYPTLRGMAAEGTPYVGFLYAGVMIDAQGMPKVIEFNCRFGDPETQPIMMRLQSDLVTLCQAALNGSLANQTIQWDPRPSIGVVLAAEGYPSNYRTGDPISGLTDIVDPDVKVFHAGTKLVDGSVCTSGGRVLCVTALGTDLKEAQNRCYDATKAISWNGMFYRRDIGWRAL